MFYVFILIFFLYRTNTLKKSLRMLQLQHYQISRSFDYLKSRCRFTTHLQQSCYLHLPFLLLFLSKENQVDLYVLMLIVYFYVGFKIIQSEQTIKLHYTKRILRLYSMLFIMYSCILYVFYETPYLLLVSLLLMSMNTLFVFLANLCLYPIEKLIQFVYIADAKKMLKDNANLVKIGVVGSYGKTSSKNILYALLSNEFYCLKSKRSFNNMMGNTLTIRNQLKHVHELFICEMGSDHVGELPRLMRFIEPQYVLLTSIGNQHLNTFKTQENIIKEKTSPLLCLSKGDIAFLNIDNKYIEANKDKGECKKVYFGEHEQAHYRIHDIQLFEWGSRFCVTYQHTTFSFETILLGYYNVMNIVGGIAVAHTLGVSFQSIQNQLAYLKPIEHRLQSIAKDHYTLIDNAFNSNVLSFKNTLDIASQIKKYRIFITPGLIDLKDNERANEQVIQYVDERVEEVVLVGYLNRAALLSGLKKIHFNNYHLVDTMEEALAYVDHIKQEDFVVFIENDIDKDFMNA